MHDFASSMARNAVCFERLLPGPLERVWGYVSDPEKRSQWLTGGGDIELRAGGQVDMVMDPARFSDAGDLPPAKYAEHRAASRIVGSVIACEPPYRLSYRWNHAADTWSQVTFELEPRGDVVLLRLTHALLPSRAVRVSISAGWHTFLDILAAKLGGEPAPSYWRRMGQLEPEYERRIPPD